MTISNRFKAFLAQEDGAVTSDFVLLSGGLLVVAVVMSGGVGSVTKDVATQIEAFLSSDAFYQGLRLFN